MGKFMNTGSSKRGQLRRAEANLLAAAKKLTTIADLQKKAAQEKRFQKLADRVFELRLGYLKARRWGLLDAPEKGQIELHAEELELIAHKEDAMIEGGTDAIAREFMDAARKPK